MLAYVPFVFDLYAALRPHLHLTMLHVCGYAGFTGECIASVRTLAASTGRSKSSVSRHLAELSRVGALTRHRHPGGCYSYRPDPRFLPQGAVSHRRAELSRGQDPAVPPRRGIIDSITETERAHGSDKAGDHGDGKHDPEQRHSPKGERHLHDKMRSRGILAHEDQGLISNKIEQVHGSVPIKDDDGNQEPHGDNREPAGQDDVGAQRLYNLAQHGSAKSLPKRSDRDAHQPDHQAAHNERTQENGGEEFPIRARAGHGSATHQIRSRDYQPKKTNGRSSYGEDKHSASSQFLHHDASILADRILFWRRSGGCWNPVGWGPAPDSPGFVMPDDLHL